jgi:hypothetical protein
LEVYGFLFEVKKFNFNFFCGICHGITLSYAQKLQTQFFFFDHVPMDPFVVASSNQNVESCFGCGSNPSRGRFGK